MVRRHGEAQPLSIALATPEPVSSCPLRLPAAKASLKDSYIIALAANVLHAAGDQAGARQVMDKLARSQDAAGNVKGAVTSIARSGGEALAIETTALSVLAWMRERLTQPMLRRA